VKNLETSFQDQRPPISAGSQKSDSSLQIKPWKQGTSDKPTQITTPPQNPQSPQASRLDQDSDMSQGVWLPSGEAEGARLVESPQHGTLVESEKTWKQGDALDEMIMVAKKMEHLPLSDDEEEEGSSSDPGDEGGSDEGSPLRAPKKQRKTSKKGSSFKQDGFSCMEGGTGVALHSNPNKRTIEILQEMCDTYVRTQDQWRSRAYRRAIGVLKKQTRKIRLYEEAKAFDGIGHRLAEKIQEIVLKDSLQRLEYAKMEPTDQILSIFLKIYGVGLSKAWEWIQAGYKTLDDLKAHAHLTDNQRIGIEHYHDFLTRIPRDEVTGQQIALFFYP
jgi:DNA polymerase IV